MEDGIFLSVISSPITSVLILFVWTGLLILFIRKEGV